MCRLLAICRLLPPCRAACWAWRGLRRGRLCRQRGGRGRWLLACCWRSCWCCCWHWHSPRAGGLHRSRLRRPQAIRRTIRGLRAAWSCHAAAARGAGTRRGAGTQGGQPAQRQRHSKASSKVIGQENLRPQHYLVRHATASLQQQRRIQPSHQHRQLSGQRAALARCLPPPPARASGATLRQTHEAAARRSRASRQAGPPGRYVDRFPRWDGIPRVQRVGSKQLLVAEAKGGGQRVDCVARRRRVDLALGQAACGRRAQQPGRSLGRGGGAGMVHSRADMSTCRAGCGSERLPGRGAYPHSPLAGTPPATEAGRRACHSAGRSQACIR